MNYAKIKKPLYRTERGLAFFVTVVIEEKKPVFGSAKNAQLMVNTLQFFRKRDEIELYGYVVMPDHVHFMLKLKGDATIANIVKRMKTFVSRQLGPDARWKEDYWPEVIEGCEMGLQKLKYIHENPVRKKLVERPEDYEWSSAKEYAKNESDLIDPM
jgi:putative transposase